MSSAITRPPWRQRWPRLYLGLRALKYLGRAEPVDPLTHSVLALLGGRELVVQGGPFLGLRYLPAASGSGLLPKLVGTYELEIQPVVSGSLTGGYRRVVNIGCGEGYYAVGYARALPAATVVAFDLDPLARQRTGRLAAINGVAARVAVRRGCARDDLSAAIAGPTLVVSDCEGSEQELLDPDRVPGLATTDLLVELHDILRPGLSQALLPRFASTHQLALFDQRPRSRADLPPALADCLSDAQCAHTLDEGRPAPMQWAWLEARARPVGAR